MNKTTKHNKKIIVGLGKTGLSCVRYLTKQGFDVAVVDSRMSPPGLEELQQHFPDVPVSLGEFDAEVLLQADELIVSPGVSLREPAIANCLRHGVKVIGDIELFARAVNAPVVAITGSNGKSTVTSLVGLMAEAAGRKVKVGGNLGVPALDLLDQNADLYVLELSSFQLETTYSLAPAAAAVLNVSSDHMDRYQDFNEYLLAKQRIYRECHVAVVNWDDGVSHAEVLLPNEAKVIGFGVGVPMVGDFGVIDSCLAYGNKKLLSVNELKIKGQHNTANVLAALALGRAIDLPLEAMLQALRSFLGLAHRCQWVANINGVDWYNDSKGTNVGATKSAIEGFGVDNKGKVVLIAGGIGKDGDFTKLHDVVTKYVRAIVLIGQDARLIEQSLSGTSKSLHANSMQEAVMLCANEALPGDMVLLSPSCASFDMFKNFEHRGEVFIEEVKGIQ